MDARFVGRTRELDDLTSRLTEAYAGRGGAVVVSGDPGIGKSVLLDMLTRRGSSAGIPLLVGGAPEAEALPEFWPWTHAFSTPVAAALGLAPAMLTADPGLEGPGASRLAAISRCVAALLQAAADGGLLITLDDLQWADRASLQLLRHLCGELRSSRVLVVGTSREPLSSTLASLPATEFHRLPPWNPAAIAEYLGSRVDPSWPSAVHRHTGGNPLFVAHVTRVLSDDALRQPAPDILPVPTVLGGLVLRRLDRLSAAARRFLDGAAAAGIEVDLDLVETAPGAVAEVIAAGALVDDPADPGRVRWSHGLVQKAWYDALPRDRRVAEHRRIAELLAAEGTRRAEDHARHRLRAAEDRPGRRAAVDACAAAAAAAAARHDHRAAGHWHARALALIDDDGARARTLLGLAEASFLSGQLSEALRHCRAAADVADRLQEPGRTDLLARAATVHRTPGGVPIGSLAALCARARGALGDEDSSRHALVLAQHARVLTEALDLPAAQPLAQRALEMAVRADDPVAVMSALHARHEVIAGPDGAAQRLVLARQLARLGDDTGSHDASVWGHLWQIDAHFQLGRTHEVDDELFALAQRVDRAGWPLARWHLLRAQSVRALQCGFFEEALGLALACRRFAADTDDLGPETSSYLLINQLHLLTGRFADQVPDPPQVPVDGFAQWLPAFRSAVGWRALQAGDMDTAQVTLAQVRPYLPTLPVDARWLETLFCCAEIAAALGDRPTTELTYQKLLPYGTQFVADAHGYHGAVSRVLGTAAGALGEHDAAADHCAQAVDMERRCGASPFEAIALLAHARVLGGRGRPGDRGHALALADDAGALARRLGMRPAAAAAGALARELSGAVAGPGTLTRREREVAALLTDGLSNRQIADRLVLSERTVETHLRNVIAKLGLANRTQVARWVTRFGIRG